MFDEMHANDHGLGGKHFWPQAKKLVEQLGSNAVKIFWLKEFSATLQLVFLSGCIRCSRFGTSGGQTSRKWHLRSVNSSIHSHV
jgi:hypothetical protein